MKYFLLISISFFSLKSFAQSDSGEIKHAHRFWVNPTQIITGQYTLAYAWNIRGRANWYEVAIGYQYLPQSLMKYLLIDPGSSPQSSPKLGMGFTGPVISFASEEFYGKVKRGMREAAENDPHLQEMIRNVKPRNSVRYELQYQYLHHPADCYYGGEEDDSYTYSSAKHCISGKMLWSRILGSDDHRVLWESYIGIGLNAGFGKSTNYIDTTINAHGSQYYCVKDIHDPNVITSSKNFGYIIPMLHMGIRMGFQ